MATLELSIKGGGIGRPILYNPALGNHEKSGPLEGCFPARIRSQLFAAPPKAVAASRAFEGTLVIVRTNLCPRMPALAGRVF